MDSANLKSPATPPGPVLSSTGEAAADLRGQVSWALVEFARNPYLSLVLIFVFAPYFATTVVGDPVRGQELWGMANTTVSVVVGVLCPFLGAMSDRQGRRKTWLAGIFAIMAAGCAMLWFAMPGAEGGLSVGTILFVAGTLLGCFLVSEVFHNAMLPSITPLDRVGVVSGWGLSLNNTGSLLVLLGMLTLIALPASGAVDWAILPDQPLFGLDPAREEHNRVAGPIAAIWLAVFLVPFWLWTPDRPSTGIPVRRAVSEGIAQVVHTVRQARKLTNVGLYLLARMFYNDGKVAVIAYSGIYAAGTFGWGLVEMLVFAIVLTPFSISGGALGGWLDTRLGSKRAIRVTIGCTSLATLGVISCTPGRIWFIPYTVDEAFWASPYFQTLPELVYLGTTMFLAMMITAAFATSRAMMARIAPVPMMSEFFGLYALSGNATAFLGHGMVTLFTAVSGSQAVGLGSLLLLLVTGFVLMHWVHEERAVLDADPGAVERS
jgi:UMF1 family MFS transporter